jgi:ATP phosphoribosyltransferase
MTNTLTIALPKGRIQEEAAPLLAMAGIHPEDAFFDESTRALQFKCAEAGVSIIRVRSFDVATFVAFGAAQMGICGSDVLAEFDYSDLYAPLDLNIGHCRLSLAGPKDANGEELARMSHVKVATKYPGLTRKFFAEKGIQAECIKLSGAMELAPGLGLSPYIVDLVSSGKTLTANGLVEIETIMKVSSRLIVNRAAFKTQSREINDWIERFRKAVHA